MHNGFAQIRCETSLNEKIFSQIKRLSQSKMSYSSDLPLSAFEFATATRIIFGCGAIKQIGAIINSLQTNGKSTKPKVFVVTGRSSNRAKPLLDLLDKLECTYSCFGVPEEPTIELATKGLQSSREQQSEIVISIGGGSVIDTGKAIAALISNGGEFIDYMEVIGKGSFF